MLLRFFDIRLLKLNVRNISHVLILPAKLFQRIMTDGMYVYLYVTNLQIGEIKLLCF